MQCCVSKDVRRFNRGAVAQQLGDTVGGGGGGGDVECSVTSCVRLKTCLRAVEHTGVEERSETWDNKDTMLDAEGVVAASDASPAARMCENRTCKIMNVEINRRHSICQKNVFVYPRHI